jgi:transcriptional regulator with XRE-family HTH domain
MARSSRSQIDPEGPEAIAKRLKALRDALKLTQAVMSRIVGSSTSGQLWGNYENYEGDWRRISLDHALALCRYCGVTLEWIYRGQIQSLPPDLAEKIRFQEMKAEEAARKLK